jgi:hypothetical protein
MVVCPTCMPWVHIFPRWERVQCSGSLIYLSTQIFSRLSYVIQGGKHDLQLQTQVVNVSCLHNSPIAIWLRSSWLGYRTVSLASVMRSGQRLLSPRLDLVEEGSTTMFVECFKRCHSYALLVTILVRKLDQWQTLVPAAMMVQYASFEHILYNLVHSLSLAIGLRMIT